jgi:ligand-binding sensor domain-containing protein/two-component sensor histidine kinase
MQKLPVLILFLIAWNTPSAQISQASFLHYTTDHGLSHDHITGIVKDNLGFLWVSTVNGLNRFDSRSFKVFRHDPNDQNSVPDNHIMGITLSPDGWLWIATNKGLCKLDPVRLHIQQIPLPENLDTIENDVVTVVAFDSHGKAWTTTERGIYKIHSTTGEQEYFFPTADKTFGWYDLLIDHEGILWMTKDTLRRFDPVTQIFKVFKGPDPRESFNHAGPLSVVQDHKGQIWAGTWYNGIWKYDKALDDFVKDPSSPQFAMMLLPDRTVTGESIFWVGGGNSGLGIYNCDSHQFTGFHHDPQDPFTHNNYLGSTLFKDPSNGDIWIGTEVGLEHYAPAAIRFGRAIIPKEKDMGQFSLVSGVVQDITDPYHHQYFIAVWGTGLFAWNKATGNFTRMRSSSQMTGGSNFNLFQDRKGNVWACMMSGAGQYHPSSGRWKDYDAAFQSEERNNLFWCGLEDHHGNVWFGSNRDGLFKYNPVRDRIESAFYNRQFASEEGALNIRTMSEDTMGRLWLAGNVSGLIRFDPVTGESRQFQYPAQNIPVVCTSVLAGKNGRIYAAFYDAFLELDLDGKLLRYFTQGNGLKTNRIYYMVGDKQGKVWFNTEYLLHCFDPVSGTFSYYGKPDGLFSNTMTDALSITHEGEIFVGFQDAFNFFYPDRLRRNVQPPPLAITSIKVMNKERSVFASKRSKFNSARDTLLILKPGEDFFQVEFAALNFNQQERNQYAYILEGFNREWIYTDRPIATFTNLDGGEYLLRMKAANNDGIWNERGLNLKIQVNPPFHRTQWFYILIALGLVGLAAGILWIRRQQRRRLEIFRESLARDLHDEMGSTLSSIRFFSDYATGQIGSDKPQVTPVLARISQSATDLSESMQDIIWAMKTQNDQLEDLASHMVEFGLRLLESRNVKFKTHIGDEFSGRHLKPEVRRNIYLIFKEAVNNAAKYSGATEVSLFCSVNKNMLEMKITDNGKGFDEENQSAEGSGYGMQNMRRRAKDIGGRLEIISKRGEGTTVELLVEV